MADQLLENYTPVIESLTFIPSGGGKFEVMADDELLYSKKATGRHAEAGEVEQLFAKKLGVVA